jgi:hypothetical protein
VLDDAERFSRAHVREWCETGFTILPRFFRPEEILPIVADFEQLYRDRGKGEGVGQVLHQKRPGEIGAIHRKQFLNFDSLPYDGSAAINLICLHPALIAFAKALLGVSKVHLYQSHTWAKYTGEADYDQPFHCDYSNHTLTVPADAVARRSVDFVVYLTDVTDDLGALHYVTKQDAEEILGPGALLAPAEAQAVLRNKERSAAGPAGALLAHGIDTMHRGTNLTAPGGRRFTMTCGYKAAGNDMIGFHVWQYAPNRPWHNVLNHATPVQLECLGIPPPGNPFWTTRTLRLTQQRWPDWDMRAYFARGA